MSNYVNTGYQRAATVTIDKKVNSTSISGYPKGYSLLAAFTANGNSYAVITATELAQMGTADYEARLADFKAYVESAESIADLDAITSAPAPAYQLNTTACPVGQ